MLDLHPILDRPSFIGCFPLPLAVLALALTLFLSLVRTTFAALTCSHGAAVP